VGGTDEQAHFRLVRDPASAEDRLGAPLELRGVDLDPVPERQVGPRRLEQPAAVPDAPERRPQASEGVLLREVGPQAAGHEGAVERAAMERQEREQALDVRRLVRRGAVPVEREPTEDTEAGRSGPVRPANGASPGGPLPQRPSRLCWHPRHPAVCR
jgi:hypothetical protein